MAEEYTKEEVDSIPNDSDTVSVEGYSEEMTSYLEKAGFKLDKSYEDARWLLKKAVEIGYDNGGAEEICLSDDGNLMFIVSTDTGCMFCHTHLPMIEKYWLDRDPEIQEIIGSLTKWKYYDDNEDWEYYEPDESLSDEENEKLEAEWDEKQWEKREEEEQEWMDRFNASWHKALEEKFGESAKKMWEY